ncbi:MAG: hypothetical protein KJ574_01150 [Nanoarchaeota archaeon]|nr:hypothetical protein [Nanoarchaeota archaeon]
MPLHITDEDLRRYSSLDEDSVKEAISEVKSRRATLVPLGKRVVWNSNRLKKLIDREQSSDLWRNVKYIYDDCVSVLGERRGGLEETFVDQCETVRGFRRSLDALVYESQDLIDSLNTTRVQLEDHIRTDLGVYRTDKTFHDRLKKILSRENALLAKLTPADAEYFETQKKIIETERLIRQCATNCVSYSKKMKIKSGRRGLLAHEEELLSFKHFYCVLVRDSVEILENHLYEFAPRFSYYLKQRETFRTINKAYAGMHSFTHLLYKLFCVSSEQTAKILTQPGQLDRLFRECGDLCRNANSTPKSFYDASMEQTRSETDTYLKTGEWR